MSIFSSCSSESKISIPCPVVAVLVEVDDKSYRSEAEHLDHLGLAVDLRFRISMFLVVLR